MTEKSRATTLSQKNRVGHGKSLVGAKDSRHGKPQTRPPVKGKPNPVKFQNVTPEQRWRLIVEAAHVRASQRGFATGNPIAVHRDWLASMAEVDASLKRAGQAKKKTAVKK